MSHTLLLPDSNIVSAGIERPKVVISFRTNGFDKPRCIRVENAQNIIHVPLF